MEGVREGVKMECPVRMSLIIFTSTFKSSTLIFSLPPSLPPFRYESSTSIHTMASSGSTSFFPQEQQQQQQQQRQKEETHHQQDCFGQGAAQGGEEEEEEEEGGIVL